MQFNSQLDWWRRAEQTVYCRPATTLRARQKNAKSVQFICSSIFIHIAHSLLFIYIHKLQCSILQRNFTPNISFEARANG